MRIKKFFQNLELFAQSSNTSSVQELKTIANNSLSKQLSKDVAKDKQKINHNFYWALVTKIINKEEAQKRNVAPYSSIIEIFTEKPIHREDEPGLKVYGLKACEKTIMSAKTRIRKKVEGNISNDIISFNLKEKPSIIWAE